MSALLPFAFYLFTYECSGSHIVVRLRPRSRRTRSRRRVEETCAANGGARIGRARRMSPAISRVLRLALLGYGAPRARVVEEIF